MRCLQLSRDSLEHSQISRVEENEAAQLYKFCLPECLDRCRNGRLRRLVHRISISSRGDRGKGKGSEPVLISKTDRLPITACQRLALAMITVAKNRSDSVNHVFRR